MNEQEIFKAYLRIQKSGVCNMFDYKTITKLSGLTSEQIAFVQKNYEKLYEKYE